MGELDEAGLKRWLHNGGGYQFVCFISWATAAGEYASRVAHALKTELTNQLRLAGWSNAECYLAKTDIPAGTDWCRHMTEALCRSVVLVAICSPSYYESEYCCREWAAMAELESLGCPERILPIVLHRHQLPSVVTSRELVEDLKDVSFLAGDWAIGPKFSAVISSIAESARHRAQTLKNRNIQAAIIPLPSSTPFDQYKPQPASPAFPLMTKDGQ